MEYFCSQRVSAMMAAAAEALFHLLLLCMAILSAWWAILSAKLGLFALIVNMHVRLRLMLLRRGAKRMYCKGLRWFRKFLHLLLVSLMAVIKWGMMLAERISKFHGRVEQHRQEVFITTL